MTDEPTRRSCPACGGSEVLPLLRQQFARIEGVSVLDGYTVVACAFCGACFAHEIPAQESFDRYYAEATKYDDAGEPSPHDLRKHDEVAEDIAGRLARRDARVLEIGCATGGLLQALARRGFRDLHGREPSPVCAGAARKNGLDVVVGSVLGELRGPFDVVILVDVLEHLVDLPAAMRALRELLVEGGTLVAEVPDAARFAMLPEAPLQQLSIEHINFFSSASLENLARAHGFEPIETLASVRTHPLGLAPEVTGFFRKGARRDPVPERETAAAIERYVAECAPAEALLHARLRELAEAPRPLAVWGCGTLTLRLLATSPLGSLPIEVFVDRNRAYHGRSLWGRTIEDPSVLAGSALPVLICSYGSAEPIERSIRARFGEGREVLRLR
ncbi:MAG: class I SAM-dependent methyltransferase [Polyangiales bacterium]